jgi:hypothetical protein
MNPTMNPKIVCIAVALLLFVTLAHADDQADCAAGQGAFLVGTVVQGPSFAGGKPRRHVQLSHTHITVRVDGQDGTYDVAMDNVFAADYVKNAQAVPASLNAIQVGDRLELCGALYQGSTLGIHFVHTDCEQTPAPDSPNGWVKEIDATTGQPGPNLEASETYCYLWN